jgi:ketosteroid isomerase-like protein
MSNRSVVQSSYDAAQTGDVGAIERVLADDTVLLEPAHHPAILADPDRRGTPGVWRGRADAVAGITAVFGALGLRGVTLHGIVVDGDRAIGLLDVHGTDHRGSPTRCRWRSTTSPSTTGSSSAWSWR